MPTPSPLEHAVSQAEDGMKLTTFIERRLASPIPLSMLHKWIRSGQVRVNKKRAKPFQRLSEGDIIRIPPFAELRQQGGLRHTASLPQTVISEVCPDARLTDDCLPDPIPGPIPDSIPYSTPDSTPDSIPGSVPSSKSSPVSSSKSSALFFDVIYQTPAVMVINKPSGLAVQPGSGLTDSVVERLRHMYAERPFIPAPAHRLDKNTSGLLAIGLTHSGLAMLSKWFASPDHAHKHYLVWVHGDWKGDEDTNKNTDGSTARNDTLEAAVKDYDHGDLNTAPTTLEDYLCKSEAGRHNMERVAKEHPKGLYALSHVTKLKTISYKGAHASLLRVALVTGRTHQIRAQLSSRGYPIMGDVRYGGKPHSPMLLHAYELALPMGTGETIRCLPLWAKPFGITDQMIYSQSL